MCAAGNIHYELNTVARDISYTLSRNPDLRCTGGTDLPEFNSRTMNLCKVRNRTMLSGFPAGRDRAGGLPDRTTETQHLRGCSRNLWDPAVMRCRAVSQPSQSRGLLETRQISKSVELLLCLGICSAGSFLLQVRTSTKTVPR